MYLHYGKRLLDILLSSIAIICLLPVLIVTALLVRLKLGSPVLFSQERPGIIDLNTGRETFFSLYKFRSMTDERGKDGLLLPDTVRLTNFGRTLRSTSLDELPELFNILKGDMSLVGPRPLASVYLNYYTKKEHRRHTVRPGLTGWAQINGRDELEIPYKAKLDGDYCKNISFRMDIKCFFKTLLSVLKSEGIVEGGTGKIKNEEIK